MNENAQLLEESAALGYALEHGKRKPGTEPIAARSTGARNAYLSERYSSEPGTSSETYTNEPGTSSTETLERYRTETISVPVRVRAYVTGTAEERDAVLAGFAAVVNGGTILEGSGFWRENGNLETERTDILETVTEWNQVSRLLETLEELTRLLTNETAAFLTTEPLENARTVYVREPNQERTRNLEVSTY